MFRMYDQYSRVINFSELTDPTETWELQDLIGEGTYGEVYSAKHKVTGELVAVKIFESIHEVIEEIEVEYKILRDNNDHPNMPNFYGLYLHMGDTGTDDQLWMVMEMCGRGSVTDLSKALKDTRRKFEEILIAHILKETLKVMVYLHKNHIIHRDIKGHNILVTEQGDIKLIDFGVSGHLDSTLDKKKTSVGTPYWMAPEVIACERQLDYTYDIRCDVWSLGITAIELAEGAPPMGDKHPMRALFRIPRNPPPTLQQTQTWSATFRDFVSKCLIKDFEARPFAWTMLEHPFIKQVPPDTSQLREQLKCLTAEMERVVHEPDVTTKQGRLKSRRQSRRDIASVATEDDLAQLEVLDEDTLVSQLFTRYSQSIIYTYIGDILLAVNPFTPLPIYNEEHSKMYVNAAKGENPPHVFAVADQAYQMLMHEKKNQCIIISGESGAGKTESNNFLVQQLTQLGKAPNRTLEERILQVNPLMEAFGNAKTVINDNSSRFGKYLEMFFTAGGTVIGAKITEYLLEKSRVISQAVGEQNFHIFYYVHDGLASEDRKEMYHLKDNAFYRYISEFSQTVPEISVLSANKTKFKAIQHCFSIIGFKTEEVTAIYGIIAAILHLGNVDFMEKESEMYAGDACYVSNMHLVENVSQLLGLETKDLVDALTTSGMVARGEIIIRENSVPEATDARDAMAKALYGRLFSWIVNKINTLLQPMDLENKQHNSFVVGLLDIFGFENFPSNSFEQLCINIANEQIQYYFNQHIFAWEMQEYKNEGIDGSSVHFVDNRPLLDMLLMKPLGLLALLDEESHFPKATDMTLVEKFHQNIKSHYYSRPKGNTLVFCINHYAGAVEYDALGFLEKNRDRLPVEIINLLRASRNIVVRSLFQTPLTKTGNLAEGSLSSVRSSSTATAMGSPISVSTISLASISSVTSAAPRSAASSMGGSRGSTSSASNTRLQQTVATYFRYSLMDLLAKMVAGSPHFVRCIRPNEDNIPNHFDIKKVTTQLKYTGVLETTRIRREGYSHRIPFADFMKRYSVLGLRYDEHLSYTKQSCHILLNRLNLHHWALGHSKVFLKYYHIEQLTRQFEDYKKKIIRIQSVVRMFITRNRFYELKWRRDKAALAIQTYFRMWVVRSKYKHVFMGRKYAAVTMQRAVRGFLTRKKVIPMIHARRAAAVKIQSVFRGHHARKETQHMKQEVQHHRQEEERSALKIQHAFRSYRAQMIAKRLREEKSTELADATIVIQTYFRMWRCRTVYQQLVKYKEQKELQLIYFGQQVERYNKDVLTTLLKNTVGIVPKLSVPEPKPRPPPLEPEIKVVNGSPAPKKQKTVKVTSPVAKQPEPIPVTAADVGEERMDHMRHLMDTKDVMPQKEYSYYHSLQNNEESTEMVVNGFKEEENNMSGIQLMDEVVDAYYSSIIRDTDGRMMDDIDDEFPSDQVIDWDQPLLEARRSGVSPLDTLDLIDRPSSPPMALSPTNFEGMSKYGSMASLASEGFFTVPSNTKQYTETCGFMDNRQQSNLDGQMMYDMAEGQSTTVKSDEQTECVTPGKQATFGTSEEVRKSSIPELISYDIPDIQMTNTESDERKICAVSGKQPTYVTSDEQTTFSFSSLQPEDVLQVPVDPNYEDYMFQHAGSGTSSSPGEELPSPDYDSISPEYQSQLSPSSDSEQVVPPSDSEEVSPNRSYTPSDVEHSDTDEATRLFLARSAAEAILANGDEPGPPSPPPLPPPPGIEDFVEDMQSDKDEFFKEKDKRDLAKHLEFQRKESFHGNWQESSRRSIQRRQRSPSPHRPRTPPRSRRPGTPPPSRKTVISVHTGSKGPAPAPPKIELSPKGSTVINVGMQNGVLGGQKHRSSGDNHRQYNKVTFSSGQPTVIQVHPHQNSHVKEQSEVHQIDNGVYDFRAKLKRTNIDPVRTVAKENQDGVQQYDFRKMLRKTGRLNFVEQEQ